MHVSLGWDVYVDSRNAATTSQDRCIQEVAAQCAKANFSEFCLTSRNDFLKEEGGCGFLLQMSWVVYKKYTPETNTLQLPNAMCFCPYFGGFGFVSVLCVCVRVFLRVCVCVCVCACARARVCCRGLGALARGGGVNRRVSGTKPKRRAWAPTPPLERMRMKMRQWIANEEKKGKEKETRSRKEKKREEETKKRA